MREWPFKLAFVLAKVAGLSCEAEQIDRDFISSVWLRDTLASGQEQPRSRRPAPSLFYSPEPVTFNPRLEEKRKGTPHLSNTPLFVSFSVVIYPSMGSKKKKTEKERQTKEKSKSMIANAQLASH